MVLWWKRSIQVRMTQSLPDVWEEMIEENGEPPQTIPDIMVTETQAVVQLHACMGDTFQYIHPCHRLHPRHCVAPMWGILLVRSVLPQKSVLK